MQSRNRKRARARTAKHASTKARPDIGTAIKKHIYAHPEAATDAVFKALTRRGFKLSRGTVATLGSDFRHSLRVLRELGVLSDPS